MNRQFAMFLTIVGISFVLFLAMSYVASIKSNNNLMDNRPITGWSQDINNPENAEFVTEVAFNEGVADSMVTQAQFNERYGYETFEVDYTVFKDGIQLCTRTIQINVSGDRLNTDQRLAEEIFNAVEFRGNSYESEGNEIKINRTERLK